MKFLKTGAGKAVIGAIVAILAIALLVGTWFFSAWVNRPTEFKDNYSIREEVVEVAQLTTYDYNFTQVLYYTSKNADNPFRIEIPFSENKYIATIDGTASVYTDLDQVIVEPSFNVFNALSSVSITLPHAQIKQPIALDFTTLNVLEKRNGFLNDITDEQRDNLLVETYEDQTEKIKNSGLLGKADVRIQEIITNQIKNIYGEGVKVNFTFIES